eukprot:TRINITY_DN6125_c0_g1_i1.p1 TRINITY_DN6125_c0_g1~~TRINITY_DN6125_c0_g1_i1.p1  ORF type:complete len:285 (+),score=-3.94 TRINITY_DN6125_c0_g1_i1:255-1109(+)
MAALTVEEVNVSTIRPANEKLTFWLKKNVALCGNDKYALFKGEYFNTEDIDARRSEPLFICEKKKNPRDKCYLPEDLVFSKDQKCLGIFRSKMESYCDQKNSFTLTSHNASGDTSSATAELATMYMGCKSAVAIPPYFRTRKECNCDFRLICQIIISISFILTIVLFSTDKLVPGIVFLFFLLAGILANQIWECRCSCRSVRRKHFASLEDFHSGEDYVDFNHVWTVCKTGNLEKCLEMVCHKEVDQLQLLGIVSAAIELKYDANNTKCWLCYSPCIRVYIHVP